MDRWGASAQGTVHLTRGNTVFLAPQWRASVQMEPAVYEHRVRAALYHALDREALADALQSGHPELAVHSLLPPGDRYDTITRDGFRQYAYNPARSRALLEEAGWNPGPDGILRSTGDGRRFHTAIWGSAPNRNQISAFADYWRRSGLEVDEYGKSATENRDLQFRALFPGWDTTGRESSDQILVVIEGPAAAPETRWAGNRWGYEDRTAQQLVDTFRASISIQGQTDAIRALNTFFVNELPILPIFYEAEYLAARRGIRALDDVEGGGVVGTHSRNAHLWDVH
jgi:peptide/nickel transport system substrate-binding protein